MGERGDPERSQGNMSWKGLPRSRSSAGDFWGPGERFGGTQRTFFSIPDRRRAPLRRSRAVSCVLYSILFFVLSFFVIPRCA